MQNKYEHHESSKEKVAKYANVLKFNVQDELSMLKLSSVKDAYQYALKIEKKLGRNQGKQLTKVDKGKKVVFDQKYAFKGTCFKCSKDGHWAIEFLGMKIDKQNFVVKEDQKVKTCDIDLALSKVGKSLLMRRVMLAKHYVEPKKRRNLFWTICKSGGKCCKVSMDGGSIDNLVFEEMVR